MANKFKNSAGKYFTKALFLETSDWNKETSIYTLSDEHRTVEGKEYLSLGKLYVAMGDVEEYDFANKYLGGWKHWQQMQNSPALLPQINEWRAELKAKLKSMGVAKLRELANEGDRNAAKWFAEESFAKDGNIKKPAGRPSKQGAKREVFDISADLEKLEQWQQ